MSYWLDYISKSIIMQIEIGGIKLENFLFIDAQTRKKGMIRLTAFGKTVEEVVKYYQAWVKENKLQQQDIWFANIFECGTNKHLGYATINNPEFEIGVFPVTNSRLDPFHRSLKQYIDLIFG